MDICVKALVHGEAEYKALLDRIYSNPPLMKAMEDDAESHPDELNQNGTRWYVVLVDGELAAWCALTGNKAHSNYEVREYRNAGHYRRAYRERHKRILDLRNVDLCTFIFPEPEELHKLDGWVRTGNEGVSEKGHNWAELNRRC